MTNAEAKKINSIYSELIQIANKLGCTVLTDEPLKNHTSFKIGGPADLFIYANNTESLKVILNIIHKKNIPFFILGNGTNLLVSDTGFRGIVLNLTKNHEKIIIEHENIINCSAGIPLAKICVTALKKGLSGLEFAWGIPGSCGGALYMNAGAYGNDMSDIIIEGTHIKNDGTEEVLSKDELNLSYRKSFYTDKQLIITSMKMKLTKRSLEIIRAKMYENITKRKSKQPLEYPNAGSTFKRPEGYYAGTLIEECGLKGKFVGNAVVSTKHAGFIINTGNATAQNICDLIKLIKETVYNKTGVLLQCEIKTLGDINL